MSQNFPQSLLEISKKKLFDYQRQETIAADPEKKFQLKQLIKECQQKIRGLRGEINVN